jgi:hypothetical protein
LGISKNTMTRYINGTEEPTKEREKQILNEVANVGKELTDTKCFN